MMVNGELDRLVSASVLPLSLSCAYVPSTYTALMHSDCAPLRTPLFLSISHDTHGEGSAPNGSEREA